MIMSMMMMMIMIMIMIDDHQWYAKLCQVLFWSNAWEQQQLGASNNASTEDSIGADADADDAEDEDGAEGDSDHVNIYHEAW